MDVEEAIEILMQDLKYHEFQCKEHNEQDRLEVQAIKIVIEDRKRLNNAIDTLLIKNAELRSERAAMGYLNGKEVVK